MEGFMKRVELEKYLPALHSLGVESFADFKEVEDRDLDAIGMSTLKKRRFRRGLQEQADGLGVVTPQNIDFDTKIADSADGAVKRREYARVNELEKPRMEPTLEGDLARVTETVELVQLAKNAGVLRGAINTCFDNEELRELIRKAQEASAAAEAPAAAETPTLELSDDDLNNLMNDYLTRYDLDGSGTFNSNDELKEFCTNIVVRLELDMDVQTIDKKLSSAGNMEELCWDFQTVKKWFVSMFAPTAAAKAEAEAEAKVKAAAPATTELPPGIARF